MTLASHPEYKIIRSEVANFYFDEGKQVMRQILATEKNRIDVLFAHNDDMALGAIESIEAAGLKPGKDVVIVSVDAVKEAFQAMLAGKLNCTVECTPLLGPQLMKVIQDYFDGKELPTRIITSEEVFPAQIARSALPRRKY
jgi:simple sugar transport system substrate-binding protein